MFKANHAHTDIHRRIQHNRNRLVQSGPSMARRLLRPSVRSYYAPRAVYYGPPVVPYRAYYGPPIVQPYPVYYAPPAYPVYYNNSYYAAPAGISVSVGY